MPTVAGDSMAKIRQTLHRQPSVVTGIIARKKAPLRSTRISHMSRATLRANNRSLAKALSMYQQENQRWKNIAMAQRGEIQELNARLIHSQHRTSSEILGIVTEIKKSSEVLTSNIAEGVQALLGMADKLLQVTAVADASAVKQDSLERTVKKTHNQSTPRLKVCPMVGGYTIRKPKVSLTRIDQRQHGVVENGQNNEIFLPDATGNENITTNVEPVMDRPNRRGVIMQAPRTSVPILQPVAAHQQPLDSGLPHTNEVVENAVDLESLRESQSEATRGSQPEPPSLLFLDTSQPEPPSPLFIDASQSDPSPEAQAQAQPQPQLQVQRGESPLSPHVPLDDIKDLLNGAQSIQWPPDFSDPSAMSALNEAKMKRKRRRCAGFPTDHHEFLQRVRTEDPREGPSWLNTEEENHIWDGSNSSSAANDDGNEQASKDPLIEPEAAKRTCSPWLLKLTPSCDENFSSVGAKSSSSPTTEEGRPLPVVVLHDIAGSVLENNNVQSIGHESEETREEVSPTTSAASSRSSSLSRGVKEHKKPHVKRKRKKANPSSEANTEGKGETEEQPASSSSFPCPSPSHSLQNDTDDKTVAGTADNREHPKRQATVGTKYKEPSLRVKLRQNKLGR